jgi:outer membrane receptor protein involved in Fe transport
MQKQLSIMAAALTTALAAHAQTSRGAVSGSVIDHSGAVVTGAAITLTHSHTGVRRSSLTNQAGLYRFEALDLGRYELEAAHPGFTLFTVTAVEVEANRTTTVDIQLEVGSVESRVTVSAEAEELLIKDAPLRGGNFMPRQVSDLPLIGLNPLSLARTLPGVSHTTGSAPNGVGGSAIQFSINGQRVRGNNFLLDGTENNDIMFTGVAQAFHIADAVQEVSVQTGNFGVEFGRAGGGVLNVVTRSGTNQIHGTALWRYQSQRFNSVSNVDKLNGIPKSVFSRNVSGFTLGGPVRKNKTFFFGGFQQDNSHSTANFKLVVPTEAAVARLRSLFPSNPRLNLYLGPLGGVRGAAAPIDLPLGLDPVTGLERGSVRFASAALALPATNDGPQWLIRLDHHRSEAHRISARYLYDSRTESPYSPLGSGVSFPGFITDHAFQNQNFLLADSFTFSSNYTNEFRFSYGRLRADDPVRISSRSVPAAQTLPQFVIPAIAAPGLLPSLYRYADNLLFQETQTKLRGRHTFRYGAEILRQLAKQSPMVNSNGRVQYTNAPGYSALANFLDDFSGSSGRIQREFADNVFHPDQLRHSYFLQDTWKAAPALTLTAGLRYEIFGQLANTLRFPAFSGFYPDEYLKPNRVNVDYNNLGPAFGLAWSPSFQSGWLGKLFGDRKTVWRGGYQISYDGWTTQMIYALAASSPNGRAAQVNAPGTGRGLGDWLARIPAEGRLPAPLDDQGFALDKDLRNPYTERWSFGFQRQLAGRILLDTSYVGSVSHKLTTRADLNPRQLNNARLYPLLGQRWVRTSEGNSAYHSLQTRVERRFARGFQLTGSYTWSRSLDSTSEGTNFGNTQNSTNQLTSIPVLQGGMRIDRGLSDFHRGQRLTLAYLWELPGPTKGWWKHTLGGWAVVGITSFQSGTPFTVKNGLDRNNDAVLTDRPDIGSPAAPLFSRAVVEGRCSTGFQSPDSGACVTPSQVHWVQAPLGLLANASTVGRNTLETGGTNNFDLSLFKSFALGDRKKVEFRWEVVNAFNHPQFTAVPDAPARDVLGAPPGRFLNRDFTDSGIRSMWVQVKLIF